LRSCSDLGSDMRFPFSLTTSKALCGVCEPQAPTQTTACGRTGFQPHPRRQRFLSCASPRWRIDATPDVSDIPLERPIGRNSPARWPTKCRSGQKRTSAPSNIRSGIDLEASLRRGGPMASINLESLTCAGLSSSSSECSREWTSPTAFAARGALGDLWWFSCEGRPVRTAR
jgi:hypothetical protein